MARTVAELPKGSRLTDYISLGVLNQRIPRAAVDEALQATGRQSARQRDLPAHVVVYYVIALALYMQSSYREVLRCLLEGLRWLGDPSARPRVAGKSGISQARQRLGAEPLQALHDAVVRPVGQPSEPGCGYRQWQVVSVDGSTLDVADEVPNAAAFGRPGASRGASAFPQIRFVSLVENGTHVLFASRMAGYQVSEHRLVEDVMPSLQAGMLCLADRNFYSYALWNQARTTGADLLWRIKKNRRLPRETPLADGSYLSRIYPSDKDRRHGRRAVRVRVIDYQLAGVADAETAVSAIDHGAGSGPRPGPGAGRPLPRALGDRNRAGRTQDPPPRPPDRPPQQDPRTRPPGVLGPDVGPLRHPLPHARRRPAARRRSRPTLLPPRGSGGPAQHHHPRSHSPLSVRTASASTSLTNSSTNGWCPAATDARPAVSSAR